MTDSLERTLRDLHFETPAGLIERAIAAAKTEAATARHRVKPRTARHFLAAAAAVVTLAVVGNLFAAYLAPVYEEALAGTPVVGSIAGPILRYSGLDESHITSVDESATSSGHTIKLLGGYADTERTVLFVDVDGRPHHLPNKQESCCSVIGNLTDQFGHSYQQINGPDPLAPTFEPLVWPASQVGARLTMHVRMLSDTQITNGDWELHLTLIQQKGVVLAVPAPVTANGITYTFDSLHLSGTQLTVRYSLSGPPVDQLRKVVYSGGSAAELSWTFSQSFVSPQLADSSGNMASITGWAITLPKQGPAQAEFGAVLSGPGQYVLTIGDAAGAPTVVIQIP